MSLLNKFSIQLYTLRDEIAKDFRGTVEKVGKMGYTGVEFAGYGDLSPSEMKSLLEKVGLEAVSSHVSMDNLLNNLNFEIEMNKAVSNRWITIPYYGFNEGMASIDKFESELRSVLPTLKENGFKVAYHNHNHEFEKIGDRYILDLLFERFSPDELSMELDLFWASCAGIDIFDYMAKNKDRLTLLHLKQIENMESKRSVDFDKGVIDFKKVIETGIVYGVQHYMLEQEDFEVSSLASAKIGVNYIFSL